MPYVSKLDTLICHCGHKKRMHRPGDLGRYSYCVGCDDGTFHNFIEQSQQNENRRSMGTWIEARPKLVIPGVLNSMAGDECHLTMAYLGDADPTAVHEMLTDVGGKQMYGGNVWPTYGPLVCEVSGTAAWRDGNNKLFRVALVSPAFGLPKQHDIYGERDRIVTKLKVMSGQSDYPVVEADETYPFVPHITLPERWQNEEVHERNSPPRPFLALPTVAARIMFIIDALYVSSSKDGEFKNVKL